MSKANNKLGLKMGTERQVIYTDLLKATETLISEGKKAMEVNTDIKAMCERIIAEEKEKFK